QTDHEYEQGQPRAAEDLGGGRGVRGAAQEPAGVVGGYGPLDPLTVSERDGEGVTLPRVPGASISHGVEEKPERCESHAHGVRIQVQAAHRDPGKYHGEVAQGRVE